MDPFHTLVDFLVDSYELVEPCNKDLREGALHLEYLSVLVV